MFKRSLRLPAPGTETFFLWGPRQTGKTTLLKAAYPNAYWIDLLKAEEYRRYLQNPELYGMTGFAVLISEILKKKTFRLGRAELKSALLKALGYGTVVLVMAYVYYFLGIKTD